ncbi:MAG: hypothetical protein JNL01_07300 [Bdellovibrionales bacterium]|nr:hypothetical protein [Bdellovibrionales bacterium]
MSKKPSSKNQKSKSQAPKPVRELALSPEPKKVVIGDGQAAWMAVAVLVLARKKALMQGLQFDPIVWLPQSATRFNSPFPGMEIGTGNEWFKSLASHFIDAEVLGPVATGNGLREFRNKSFRPAPWLKSGQVEDFWDAESRFPVISEAVFSKNLFEIEETIRAELIQAFDSQESSEGLGLIRWESGLVSGFRVEAGQVTGVEIGGGAVIPSSEVVFADRWATLSGMSGLPKFASLNRKREPVGLLQVVFTHEPAMNAEIAEGLFTALHRDPGEEIERHVWGYLVDSGRKSVWSVLLSADESSDNHQVGRKLKRMKQALEKVFQESHPVSFEKSVIAESLRFEEAVVNSQGEVVRQPLKISGAAGLSVVGDGYGFEASCAQVAAWSVQAGLEVAASVGLVLDAGSVTDTVSEQVALS